MANGGRLGARNVPGVDGLGGVWSLQEIANARRLGLWPGYFEEVMADNPVVYYRLDETSGTTAADSSGNSNTGTYVGEPVRGLASHMPGELSVLFDGSNDRIDGPTINLIGDATVEVWYTPTSFPSQGYVMSHAGATASEAEAANFTYSIYANGSGIKTLWEYGGGTNETVDSGMTMTLGVRYHIVIERDATAKTVTFTVNGTANTVGYTNNPTGGGSGILVVGFAAGQHYASGIIEQAAVYDHLLGSARVLAHYNAGIGA